MVGHPQFFCTTNFLEERLQIRKDDVLVSAAPNIYMMSVSFCEQLIKPVRDFLRE